MELPSPQLNSGTSASHLSLRTQIMALAGSSDYEDAELHDHWSGRHRHEVGHWLRYHGSTVGLYLTLLKLSRDLLAVDYLRSLDPASRAFIGETRRRGDAIWSYHHTAPSKLGESWDMGEQIWLDAYYAQTALLDFAGVDGLSWNSDEALRFSMADVWTSLGALDPLAGSFAEFPGHDAARNWLRGDLVRPVCDGTELTTRLLWECASTLDELRFGRRSARSEQGQRDIFAMAREKLEGTSYGLPVRIAEQMLGQKPSLELLLFLLDFATNPPLPFLSKTSNPALVTWNDFYPPLRFIAACEMVEEHPTPFILVPQAEDANAVYRHLRRAMRDHGGPRYGSDDFSTNQFEERANDRSAPGFTINDPDLDRLFSGQHHSHLLAQVAVSRHLLGIREHWPAITTDGRNNELLFVADKSTFGHLDSADRFFRMSLPYEPFISYYEDKLHPVRSAAISDEQAARYMSSVMQSCILDDLLNSTGALEQEYLPVSMREDPSTLITRMGPALLDLTRVKW
jgi:hypothetical protein